MVVKDSSYADLLRKILPGAVRSQIEFVIEEGESSALSVARTLLALGGRPTALLVDSGTEDESKIASRRKTLDALLENASTDFPGRVFMAIPNLKEVYDRRTAINQIPLGKEITAFVNSLSTPQPSHHNGG
jgi:hypothetical protein